MSKKKHAEHDEEHENSERWLLTYADMITLLMALFIVLYSMSVLNKSKFEAFQSSLKQSKNTGQPDIKPPAPKPTDKPQPPEPNTVSHGELEHLKQALIVALKKVHEEKAATLVIDDRGLAIKLTSGVLFDSGQSILLPEGARVMDALGPELSKIGNNMTIEGHTDNQPINTGPYPTNWELSTSRATTVLRRLLDEYHLTPSHLQANGFADTRPDADNSTVAGRAKNRRVVLLVQAPVEATTSGDGTLAGSTGEVSSDTAATESGHAEAAATETKTEKKGH